MQTFHSTWGASLIHYLCPWGLVVVPCVSLCKRDVSLPLGHGGALDVLVRGRCVGCARLAVKGSVGLGGLVGGRLFHLFFSVYVSKFFFCVSCHCAPISGLRGLSAIKI